MSLGHMNDAELRELIGLYGTSAALQRDKNPEQSDFMIEFQIVFSEELTKRGKRPLN